jgi:NodT family efflux transporter outer membrane factor (OMF) lipoprotein
MFRRFQYGFTMLALVSPLCIFSSGCTSFREYVSNGFKVGHNYSPPSAPVAKQWIAESEEKDRDRVRVVANKLSLWWTAFNDPDLNRLMSSAYRQNLTLRQAGMRVLESRAQLGITTGLIFPQAQSASAGYRRTGGTAIGFGDAWNLGFNLAWELDFWGQFRRAISAANDQLDASIENYDAVLVTLMGDVASTYVRIRTDQERLRLLQENVDLQQNVILPILRKRLEVGKAGLTSVDVLQAESTLAQTLTQIPPVLIDMRQANDQLCTLLGIPVEDLTLEPEPGANPYRIGSQAHLPSPPPVEEINVYIPAELLRHRPDIRQAERLVAAQAEQIGIAESDFYPAITINGSMGYTAAQFSHLFNTNAFTGSFGPSFQWNILNYGRIINNVRLQDARFQEVAISYQNLVLAAGQEVEDGLVNYLRSVERKQLLDRSVEITRLARDATWTQYDVGLQGVDYNRWTVLEQNFISQQDSWAQARGQILQGMIQVYRALGGGWQIRLNAQNAGESTAPMPPMPADNRDIPEGAAQPPIPAEAPTPAPKAVPNPPQ